MEFHLPSSSYKTIPRPPPPSSYHRKCTNGISFSESILRCGFYKDTTIQNATRQSSRHKKVIERKQSSMV